MSASGDSSAPAKPRRLARRTFLVAAGLLGGGLMVGAGYLQQRRGKNKAFKVARPQGGGGAFGAWLTINTQGRVTVFCPHQEMGQGIMSLVASLVAEELDADPAQMEVVQAPVSPAYANPTMVLDGLPFRDTDQGLMATTVRATMRHVIEAIGVNGTGGSTATRNVIDAVQRSAAAARSMLLEAAASRLSVDPSTLRIERGVVSHPSRPETLGLGNLAEQASWLKPREASPKPRSAWRMLGSSGMPRLDVPSKVDGSAVFGIDVRLPGMLYAAVRHCPVFGGTVQSVTFAPNTPAIKGTVRDQHFIASIATSWWAAKQHVDAAMVAWNEGPMASVSSASIFKQFSQALDAPDGDVRPHVFEKRGDPLTISTGPSVTAEYRVPFLAHATMEPMNATAWIRQQEGRQAAELWVGNQGPLLFKWLLADAAGVKSDDLSVNTPLLGGGFGRRIEIDVAREALVIARSMPGVPVQTIWSREEDMQHDVYRPAALARFTARLDAQGKPSVLRAHLASASVAAQFMQRNLGRSANAAGDRANVEGVMHLPYRVPHLEVRHSMIDAGIPVGFWRSVGHSQGSFFAESFIDECAHAAKQDPLAYRLALLRDNPNDPIAQRSIKVLEAVAHKAQWSQPLEPVAGAKVGRGVALAESFRSIVAQVVEVVVGPGEAIRVRRVTAAVDCGVALDPVNVVTQIRSGVHFGLTAAMYGRIDIEGGRVRQGNFTDYRMLTLADAPTVDVVIVPSDGPLGGIGEVSVPPAAPALVNAIRAASGRAVRELPILT